MPSGASSRSGKKHITAAAETAGEAAHAAPVVPRLLERTVISGGRELVPEKIPVRTGRSGKSYPGFGVENSLDGEPDNNYTAFYQDSEQFFELQIPTPVEKLNGEIVFLNKNNFAREWRVDALDGDGQSVGHFVQQSGAEQNQPFTISAARPIHTLRFSFAEFHGQPRLLMRSLVLHRPVPLPEDAVIRLHYSAGANLHCRSLKMDFSKCSYRPAVITARATDRSGNCVFCELFTVTGNLSPTVEIAVNQSFAFLQIEMAKCGVVRGGCFDDAPECTFRFDPEQERELAEDRELHKKIILKADDPANPLSIRRQPVTEYYRHLADKLIRESGKKAPSDFDKIMIFMEYVCRFELGRESDTEPFCTLIEKIGICGSLSSALNALSAASGIRCRTISLCNFPQGNGHVVTEQFIDGKWRVFDPTYGLYYKNAETDEIMSFEELRDPANRGIPVCLNRTRYSSSGKIWGTQKVYLDSNPAGPAGLDHPMLFPEKISLTEGGMVTPPDVKYQGANYLGAAMVNANQEWHLTGLRPGKNYRFTMIPSHIGGDSGELYFVFRCQVGERPAETVRLHRDRLQPVHVDFTADAPEMKIKLFHAYRGPAFHYLRMKRYTLSER